MWKVKIVSSLDTKLSSLEKSWFFVGVYIINTIVAGTNLEKSELKKFTNHSALKKNNSRQTKGSIYWTLRWSRQRRTNNDSLLHYLNDENPALGKSGYWQFPTSLQLWLYSPIDGRVGRKPIPASHEEVHQQAITTAKCLSSWAAPSVHLRFQNSII